MSVTNMTSNVVGAGRERTQRRLAVTWQHPATRKISPVAILEFSGDEYRFVYIRGALAVEGFRPLLGFPQLDRLYQSSSLFPLFAQRVMDPRRPDHDRYVARLGLPVDATPWEQMSRSGGSREGDTLQLFPEPQVEPDGRVRCFFLVHGLRHVPSRPIVLEDGPVSVSRDELEGNLGQLRRGSRLRLVCERGNPVNPMAVLTATLSGSPLGWVPDLLLHDLYRMTSDDPEVASVVVEHINGPDVPPHLRLMVELTVMPQRPYRPFEGPVWEALA